MKLESCLPQQQLEILIPADVPLEEPRFEAQIDHPFAQDRMLGYSGEHLQALAPWTYLHRVENEFSGQDRPTD